MVAGADPMRLDGREERKESMHAMETADYAFSQVLPAWSMLAQMPTMFKKHAYIHDKAVVWNLQTQPLFGELLLDHETEALLPKGQCISPITSSF